MLDTLKSLQTKYLQAKLNYLSLKNEQTLEELNQAENELITFEGLIVDNHQLSPEERQKIIETMLSFSKLIFNIKEHN